MRRWFQGPRWTRGRTNMKISLYIHFPWEPGMPSKAKYLPLRATKCLYRYLMRFSKQLWFERIWYSQHSHAMTPCPKIQKQHTCVNDNQLKNTSWKEIQMSTLLPSLKVTLHLKMHGWKTSFLFEWPIFSGYVSFRECILDVLTNLRYLWSFGHIKATSTKITLYIRIYIIYVHT